MLPLKNDLINAKPAQENMQPTFTSIQTSSFTIKFFNNRNKTLQRFLLELTPQKPLQHTSTMKSVTKKDAFEFLMKENAIESIRQKFQSLHAKCSTPQPIENDNDGYKKSDTDRGNADGEQSVSPSLKKKVINELFKIEGSDIDGMPRHNSIEDMEQMMDVHMLKDGSILVKPNGLQKSEYEKDDKRFMIVSVQKQEHMKSPVILGTKMTLTNNKNRIIKPRTDHNTKSSTRSESSSASKMKISNKSIDEKSALAPKRLCSVDEAREPLRERKTVRTSLQPLKEKNICKPAHDILEPIIPSKPTTSIKMLERQYDHLLDHPINVAIKNVNLLILAAFKGKENAHNAGAIVKYAKSIGIKLSASKITPDFLKLKENFNIIKEKSAKYLSQIINTENTISPHEKSTANYRYFVGKGNNSQLVRNAFKQRWWWTSIEKTELEKANLVWTQLLSRKFMEIIPSLSKGQSSDIIQLANHLENHFHISNKKAMFLNIRGYFERIGKEPGEIIPLTFHIKSYDDPELSKFEECYNKFSKDSSLKNIWIMKPGEYTNRGMGITVEKDLAEIKAIIKKTESRRTNIIQKYIEKPLLISKRKFDIRCYGMMTSINGSLNGYWYNEGYLRTSCKEFTTKNLANKYIHLTNDAVQKNNEEYGKYEAGNNLSYTDLQKYFDNNYPELNIDFKRDINSQIKTIITDSFRATYHKIDPNKKLHTFEVFGFDFMLDDSFKMYLIEVNTNPCLETGCPLLNKVIPPMLDSALRYVIDSDWRWIHCFLHHRNTLFRRRLHMIYFQRIDLSWFLKRRLIASR